MAKSFAVYYYYVFIHYFFSFFLVISVVYVNLIDRVNHECSIENNGHNINDFHQEGICNFLLEYLY